MSEYERLLYIKAVHQWVARFGMTPMPTDPVEWYRENIVSTDADFVFERLSQKIVKSLKK